MRKILQNSNVANDNSHYKILAVDDEQGIIDSLSIFLKRSGYNFVGVTDPLEAIEKVKTEHFDMLLLDFIMTPLHGDQVVEEIRKFDKEIYILLLTGHKDLAPPLDTIRKLDIQGYCEKSDKFDQLLLLIESGIKSISQMNEIKEMNKELSLTYEQLGKAYLGSIQALRYAVEAKDMYTKGHSDRVSAYSVLIGKHLGLSDSDLKTLEIGGYFHDIGKIGISDTILRKAGKLTDEEFAEIKKHPVFGVNILSPANIFQDILPIVNYHHEKYDGTGYPDGLKGDDIPYLARIAAIADTYDAMTSKRSYRNPLPLEKVISEFERCKGSQFDPALADLFLDLLRNHYDEISEIMEKYQGSTSTIDEDILNDKKIHI